QRDDLGEIDGEPSNPSVVDAPELRLETFAERDDLALGTVGEEASDLLVETPGAQRLPLAEAALPETLERVVDGVDELDRLRVLEDRVGTPGLGGPLVEIPQQRLRHAA